MKKALLSLLLGLVALPMAVGQTKDHREFHIVDTTMCTDITWRNGQTYTTDTSVMYVSADTIYVLNYTRLTTYIDTAKAIEVLGECAATWNSKLWATPGAYYDTLQSIAGCDSVVKINVKLAVTSEEETVEACGSYTSYWGTVYTASHEFDTTITNGDCTYDKVLHLTVHPVYPLHNVTVTAGCAYNWNGQSIQDFVAHVDTLATATGGCDSIVSLRVTAYSGMEYDTTEVVSCDSYDPSWYSSSITTNGYYTREYTQGTYPTSATTTGQCRHFSTFDVTIITSNDDTNSITPVEVVGACSYVWAGQTITDNLNHFHVFTSVIGGCDSVAGIRVTEYTGETFDTLTVEHCGDKYQWKNTAFVGLEGYSSSTGFQFTTDTVATVTVNDTENNCAKHYTLDLTFYTKHDTLTRRICGYEYTYSGYQVLNSTGAYVSGPAVTFSESGIYDVNDNGDAMYTRSNGCATRHSINLNLKAPRILYRSTDKLEVEVCDKYDYNLDGISRSLTVSCDTTLVSPNRDQYNTCYDSVLLLNLTVKKSSTRDTVVHACDNFYWYIDSVLYTHSADKQVKIAGGNTIGCDSIVNLKLTVSQTPEVNISGEWVLLPGESTVLRAESEQHINSYRWYVNNASTAASTADTLLLENVQANTDVRLEATSGNGCPAINWLTVTATLGIDDIDGLQASVYPNPTSRFLNIESGESLTRVELYNSVGQLVVMQPCTGNSLQLDLGQLGVGHYSLRITGANGQLSTRKIIINK